MTCTALALPTKYPGGKIIKKEMGGICDSYGRQKRCIQGFGGGYLRRRDHLEDLGVDGTKI